MLDPSLDLSWVTLFVPLSVFFASLIGSPHCVAMCGPLVLNFASDRTRLFAYQGGRALGYTAAGAVAGTFGEHALGPTTPSWLSALSLLCITALLIVTGVRALTNRSLHFPMPVLLSRAFARPGAIFWKFLAKRWFSPRLNAALAGVFTVFLPCGHLYGFIVGAMATGSTIRGSVFMLTFWLGTVPAMGFGVGWLAARLRGGLAHGPRWAGALLILAGLFSLWGFASRLPDSRAPETVGAPTAIERGKALRCH